MVVLYIVYSIHIVFSSLIYNLTVVRTTAKRAFLPAPQRQRENQPFFKTLKSYENSVFITYVGSR